MNKNLLLYLFNKLLIGIALIILFDFLVPSTSYTDTITLIGKQKQQYYNAAKNSHSTYTIHTKNNSFYTSKKFALKAKQGNLITYKKSLLFKEINSYSLTKVKNSKETYSLRFFTGLIIPLLTIITLFLFKKKTSVLLLIVKFFLIADFLFLLFY